jgi:DNA-binding XRE family transcriptional regulator
MRCFSKNGALGQTGTDRYALACYVQNESSFTLLTNLCLLYEVCGFFYSVEYRALPDVDDTLLQRNLGDVIRSERLSLGLSQEELAERCQLHRSYIGSVERGERNISIQNVVRIARALNLRVWTLIRAAEESNAT